MQAPLNSAASYTIPKKAIQQPDQEEGELRVQETKSRKGNPFGGYTVLRGMKGVCPISVKFVLSIPFIARITILPHYT